MLVERAGADKASALTRRRIDAIRQALTGDPELGGKLISPHDDWTKQKSAADQVWALAMSVAQAPAQK